MSTYEKIATVIIVILVVPMIIFSFREIQEPSEQTQQRPAPPSSRFNASLGQDLRIGAFATIQSENSSGVPEQNCEPMQPIIIGVLHDIKERLEHQKTYVGVEDPFEVNEQTLQLLCNTTAHITLADTHGNTLLLQKIPFTRVVPQGGSADDVGTDVRINATLIPAGSPMPAEPTTFGEVLIPDRFLDTATSSRQ